ncbi:MAG: class I SAM-dependent methyltransferase [Candidatus Bathyarchaeia archaeon]
MDVLRGLEKYALDRGLPIIGPEKAAILAEAVRKTNPRLVLELGTLIGYSTIVMGREMCWGSKIITVEEDSDEAVLAKRNIRKAGLKPEVEVLVGDAKLLIKGLRGCFDFVFLDADHREFIYYLHLLEDGRIRRGTVLFADNARIYGGLMKKYLDHVRRSGLYESQYIQVGFDGVEISVRL